MICQIIFLMNRRSSVAGLFLAAVLLAAAGCNTEKKPSTELPNVRAALGQTSASGISSGAYMAGQFEIAHSDIMVGAAIIAGGPFGCAESIYADVMPGPGMAFFNLSKAVNGCMLSNLRMFDIPAPKALARRARALAAKGRINSIDDVLKHRIYLFTGARDHTVVPEIVGAAHEFYKELGLPAAQIRAVKSDKSGHAFITEDQGDTCDASRKPFINDCDYDQAGDLLAHIYGPLRPRAAAPGGSYIVFDQAKFTTGVGDHGMAASGIVYVPASCQEQPGCRIHIAYHGCGQNRTEVGDDFAKKTGFARWADSNNIVVLFPQVRASSVNPQGCWDWWGYTGSAYLTREAPQIRAVRAMLDRLAGVAPATNVSN